MLWYSTLCSASAKAKDIPDSGITRDAVLADAWRKKRREA